MSNGIGRNPLNDISKVYLEMRESYKIEPPRERLKTDRNMFNIPKSEQDAAKERIKAKTAAKRAKMNSEALDPVGQEDGDINNDGKKDKTDKYLMNRRKKIGKAIAAKEEFSDWRADLQEQGLIEVMDETEAAKPIKEKKVNNKVKINPKLGEAIEEIGGTLIESIEDEDLNDIIESVYTELIDEGYINDDVEDAIEYALTEARVTFGHDTESPRQKMLKKAKGRLKFLGRKAGEAASSAKKKAGQVAGDVKKKAVNTATDVAFAGSAAKDKVKSALSTAKKRVSDAPKVAKKSIKDRIKQGALAVAKRMSEENIEELYKGKHGQTEKEYADSRSQGGKMISGDSKRSGAEYTHGRRVKVANPGMQPDVGGKTKPKSQGKMDRGSRADLAYRKANLKQNNEELSIDQQMKIARDAAKDRNPNPDHKAIRGKMLRKPLPKDTRTDAQKMTDAVGKPRMGSSD